MTHILTAFTPLADKKQLSDICWAKTHPQETNRDSKIRKVTSMHVRSGVKHTREPPQPHMLHDNF